MFHIMHSRTSYHKVSSNVGLEDSIKGASGIRTVVKREETRNISQAPIVVSCAFDLQVVIRFIRIWSFIAWSIKHTAQLYGVTVTCRIAGVNYRAV